MEPVSTEPKPLKRVRRPLLWLFIFLYGPFVLAHGIECWSQPAYDFPPLYSATKRVFDQHQSPYGHDAFAEQAAALGRWVPPFIYPPSSLLAFWPLHFFDYDTAKALMLVVNHLCLLFSAWFILKRLFREEFAAAPTELAAALALVYILLFDPAASTLHLGQVNLLLLVCVCLTWHALRRNHGAFGIAVPLSLAILIKTYPVLLLPLLVFQGRFKAVAYTVGLFAVYCAFSYVVLPSTLWPDWITKIVPDGAGAHPGPWNQNIRAFVARAFQPNDFSQVLWAAPGIVKPLIGAASLAVFATTLLISFLSARRFASVRATDMQLSLYLLMIFLIAPVSWEHHFVYLLPSLILILLLLLRHEICGHWRWITALSLCLIGWRFPITNPALTKGWWILLISAKFYPAVALWIYFLIATRRGGKDRREEEPQNAAPR